MLTELTYDELNRPTTVAHSRSGVPLLTLGYTFDANGNLATMTDDTGTAAFGYNDLDRLTSADYAGSNDYDAVGNLTEAVTPAGTRTYSYDLADRITSGGVVYDDNGSITDEGTYGPRTYSYDALGRLTGVNATGLAASYELDGAGNRRAETVNAVSTAFDLDLSAANPTILHDGTRTYLPGAPGAGYEQGGIWWSALTDLVGSPLQHVSQAGATTSPVHYDPYGAQQPVPLPRPVRQLRQQHHRRTRADPRRSIQRQRAATASPARFRPLARHPEHGGNEPCSPSGVTNLSRDYN